MLRSGSHAALAAAVVFAGSCAPAEKEPAPDERTAIVLSPQARAAVLAEMRLMLSSLNGVLDAASREDAEGMARAAAASGMAAAVDPALERVLPKEFVAVGMRTHQAYDALAAAVTADGGPGATDSAITHLARLTTNCVACHEAYRLETR